MFVIYICWSFIIFTLHPCTIRKVFKFTRFSFVFYDFPPSCKTVVKTYIFPLFGNSLCFGCVQLFLFVDLKKWDNLEYFSWHFFCLFVDMKHFLKCKQDWRTFVLTSVNKLSFFLVLHAFHYFFLSDFFNLVQHPF